MYTSAPGCSHFFLMAVRSLHAQVRSLTHRGFPPDLRLWCCTRLQLWDVHSTAIRSWALPTLDRSPVTSNLRTPDENLRRHQRPRRRATLDPKTRNRHALRAIRKWELGGWGRRDTCLLNGCRLAALSQNDHACPPWTCLAYLTMLQPRPKLIHIAGSRSLPKP